MASKSESYPKRALFLLTTTSPYRYESIFELLYLAIRILFDLVYCALFVVILNPFEIKILQVLSSLSFLFLFLLFPFLSPLPRLEGDITLAHVPAITP